MKKLRDIICEYCQKKYASWRTYSNHKKRCPKKEEWRQYLSPPKPIHNPNDNRNSNRNTHNNNRNNNRNSIPISGRDERLPSPYEDDSEESVDAALKSKHAKSRRKRKTNLNIKDLSTKPILMDEGLSGETSNDVDSVPKRKTPSKYKTPPTASDSDILLTRTAGTILDFLNVEHRADTLKQTKLFIKQSLVFTSD